MLTLQEMTATDFDHYIHIVVPAYAQDKIKSGAWKKEVALKLSEETFATHLPQQQETPDEYLYTILLNNQVIGYVWFHFNPVENDAAFLYDFLIIASHQNQGYGTQAMTLIENQARIAGAKTLALHVFAHNERAVHVYQKNGFQMTDYSMAKKL